MRAIAKLGFVQADPIRSPARAQDLILRHRVTGYRAGDLERRYPRLDVEQARPRTPSFYGLEILRVAEGELRGFEHLAQKAADTVEERAMRPLKHQKDALIGGKRRAGRDRPQDGVQPHATVIGPCGLGLL